MSTIYRFKWQLIIICIGLALESFASIAGNENFAVNLYKIGLWIKITGLLGLIWKLLSVEMK